MKKNLKVFSEIGFLKNIKKAKTCKELNFLLKKFFTPDEKIMIEKRLGILYLLEKGLSYRQIGEEIEVAGAF